MWKDGLDYLCLGKYARNLVTTAHRSSEKHTRNEAFLDQRRDFGKSLEIVGHVKPN
jgi:hypothetical protein